MKHNTVVEIIADNCIHEDGNYYFENVKTRFNNVPVEVIKDTYIDKVEEFKAKAVI